MPALAGDPISILLIEDDPNHAFLIQRHLKRFPDPGTETRHAETLEEARQALEESWFDLILVDLKLPDSELTETLPRLFEMRVGDAAVIVLTSLDDVDFAVQALNQGAQDYLVKSTIKSELLFRSIRHAILRHRISRQLRERNEELHRFASIVAHEVRTPLQVVTTCLDVMEARFEDQLDDSTERFLTDSRQAITNVAQLAGRLLDFARVGADEPDFQRIDLDRLLRDATFTIQNAFPEVEVIAEVEDLPEIVGDPLLIQQLLTNILSNAVKYREGDVAKIQARGEIDEGGVQIEIEDAGIGIPRSERERVFEIFRRGKKRAGQSGHGLGLAFCKRVVEHHGGRIWIEKGDEGGCRICLTLPKPKPDESST